MSLNPFLKSATRINIVKYQSLLRLLFLAFSVCYIYFHLISTFSFPIPWSDEAVFYYQSKAFMQYHDLFASQLNPERTLFWMPPAYMMFCGLVFKLTGFHLEVMRYISMIFILFSFTVLWKIIKKHNPVLILFFLSGLFLLSRAFIIAGNIARMEAMMLFFCLCGFELMSSGRKITGLSILLFSLLFHPVGVFFVAAGIVLLCITGIRDVKKYTISDYVIILGVIICGLLYALYIVANWHYFIEDMKYQSSTRNINNLISESLT